MRFLVNQLSFLVSWKVKKNRMSSATISNSTLKVNFWIPLSVPVHALYSLAFMDHPWHALCCCL